MTKRLNKKMASIKDLLELRRHIKSKKPDFIRQDFHKKKRLSRKWRRPKGWHSKIRLNRSVHAEKASIGYRSPKIVRGLHKSGLLQNIIRSVNDLEGLDPKKNCGIISSSVGTKKRVVILKKAKDLGLNIFNIKNPDKYIKEVEDKINLRKKAKEVKTVKEKDAKKVEKREEKLTEKVDEVSKKEIEKKEKDKVLTKKEI